MSDGIKRFECPVCGAAPEPKTYYRCQAGHRWWAPNEGPQTLFYRTRAHEVLFGGAAGGGKAIALDTPVPTPDGWTTMGALRPGDRVLGGDGRPTTVLAATETMRDRPCFRLTFEDGERIVADGSHLWLTGMASPDAGPFSRDWAIRTTAEIAEAPLLHLFPREGGLFAYLDEAEAIESVPVRCIQVDRDDGLFLAGKKLTVTHNSAALITLPLQHIGHPQFRGLILRRTTPELMDLMDKARDMYGTPEVGAEAKSTGGGCIWTFPSGAKIQFNHCQHDTDAYSYQGREFHFLGFDELTHFTLKQYQELKSRVRASVPGLPRHIRATTNPGGDGHEWVMAKWGAWLDPKFEAPGISRRDDDAGVKLPPLAPGQVAWVEKTLDGDTWHTSRPSPYDPATTASRMFIPAMLSDNPALIANDPGYARNLMDLDPVRRAQLLGGNWLARPARGLYFRRTAAQLVEATPAWEQGVQRCRYWDRAASIDGDWTVGVKMARTRDGLFWVEDVARFRGVPSEVEARIKQTCQLDGVKVLVLLEQDPGQAGLFETAHYIRQLAGFNVRAVRKTASKLVAAGPASAQWSVGNVRVAVAPWTDAYLAELEAFPEAAHDDQVDATAGAFNHLANSVAPTLEVPRVPMPKARW